MCKTRARFLFVSQSSTLRNTLVINRDLLWTTKATGFFAFLLNSCKGIINKFSYEDNVLGFFEPIKVFRHLEV